MSEGSESAAKSSISLAEPLPEIFSVIKDDVLSGYKKKTANHINEALSGGYRASDILNDCLIPAINLGRRLFQLSEILFAAADDERGYNACRH